MPSKTKPGEKGFSIALLIIGILALIESIRMYMKEPTPSSFGALPLFLSSLIVICMIKIIFFEERSNKANASKISLKELLINIKNYVFPKDIVTIFIFMVVYCLLLVLGIGFEISSTLFLIISMTYLMRGQLLKNLIYTGIIMTLIFLVFSTIFQVILP